MNNKVGPMAQTAKEDTKKPEEAFVLLQLEHDRKKVLPVKLEWIFEHERIRDKLESSVKVDEPVFFFYHKNYATSPSFSVSLYRKELDTSVGAVYKGYLSNKIYGKREISEIKNI